jgi:hypothetical protein
MNRQWRREGVKAGGGGDGQNGRKAENVCSIGCPLLFSENFLSSAQIFRREDLFFFFFALHPGFLGFQEDFPVTFAQK